MTDKEFDTVWFNVHLLVSNVIVSRLDHLDEPSTYFYNELENLAREIESILVSDRLIHPSSLEVLGDFNEMGDKQRELLELWHRSIYQQNYVLIGESIYTYIVNKYKNSDERLQITVGSGLID